MFYESKCSFPTILVTMLNVDSWCVCDNSEVIYAFSAVSLGFELKFIQK